MKNKKMSLSETLQFALGMSIILCGLISAATIVIGAIAMFTEVNIYAIIYGVVVLVALTGIAYAGYIVAGLKSGRVELEFPWED